MISFIRILVRNMKHGIFHLCVDIPLDVHIPRSTRFPHHAMGVVIGHGVKIGEHVVIGNYVTLGYRSPDKPGVPVVEDFVHLHPYCCVLGGVTVGHHSEVGAYSLVLDDVPPYSVVFGVPACVVRRKEV